MRYVKSKLFTILFWSVILFLFIYINKNIRIAKIVSNSMSPSIKKGDYVIYKINNFSINKNDILLFKKNNSDSIFIKRCWALPKDSIYYFQGKYYNQLGRRFKEKSVKMIIPYKGFVFNKDDTFLYQKITDSELAYNNLNYIVADDYYYLRGDNILNSIDSRETGPIKRKNIIGKVCYIFN